MAAAKNDTPWKTISLQPLVGMMDLRSRPADIPMGAFRYKLNVGLSPEGKLCRRGGFQGAWADALYDSMGFPLTDPNHPGSGVFRHNHDHHKQNGTREPITFLYEHTKGDQTRMLFDGTQSRLSVLNADTGAWTDLLTGKGNFGSRWRACSSQGRVLFANGVNDLYQYPETGGGINTIPDLVGLNITAPKLVIEFNGIVLIMNVLDGGVRQPSRIYWSDLNDPLSWNPAVPDTLAGKQDLPYGDEILAAAPMLNALYIYTRRSIWRMTVSGQQEKTFDFFRVYDEPRNQTGCIVYPFTLVSTGTDHYYASRESIYHYNPYMKEPECETPDLDWLHRAAGAIFTKLDTRTNGVQCNAPTAEWVPQKKELWISWPSGNRTLNDWTLVAQMLRQTADLVDEGFTAMCNFRRSPLSGNVCNESQDFLAVSSTDYCIKSVGNVFYREYAVLGDTPGDDLPDNVGYVQLGYNSVLRIMVPTGLFDRDKTINKVLVDPDISEQDKPCLLLARVGNSFTLQDPNDADDVCAVQWRTLPTFPLACPNMKISKLTAANQKQGNAIEFPCYEENRFLYLELKIVNWDGTEAIGGDVCLSRIDFNIFVKPKPN